METTRIILMSLFFLVLIGMSTLSSYVVSTSFLLGKQGTTITLLVGTLLPILFILSLLLSRNDNGTAFAGAISLLSAVAVYIIGSAIIASIFIGLWSVTKHTPPPLIITKSIILVGALCGIIGVLQTRTLVVREYTIQNSTLPDSWDGMRAVLVSDTHYGTLIRQKSAERVVRKIQSLSPEIVFHTGDLFDGPRVDGNTILTPWKELTQTTPVFYVSGNHEVYGPYTEFVDFAKDAGFTVVHNTSQVYKGVTIAGIPYIDKKESKLASELLNARMSPEVPTLLLNHHPAFIEEVEAQGVFLMLSGHTHRGQFWPIRYIVRTIYGKYFYGKHQFENLTTLTTSGTGFSGIPQKFLTPPEIVLITFKK